MNIRLLTPILLVTCASLASAGEPTSPVERFQRALTLEESEGDAKAALAIYRELTTQTETPAALRVRAELRVAACYERLGQREEARQRYAALAAREKTWLAVAKAARAGADRLEPAAPADASSPLPKGWLSSWDPKTKLLQFSVKDVDVRALLCELARIGGQDLVLSPEVAGEVTTELRRVTARSAMEAIVNTVGDYALIEVEGLLRVVPKSSLERQLATEVYQLRPQSAELQAKLTKAATPEAAALAAAALVAHQDHHRRLTRVVSELLLTSGVPGAWAGYDVGTESIFVRCGRDGHAAVRKALAQGLVETLPPRKRAPSSQPLVSARFQDASADYALSHLAKAAKSPLILGSEIRGEVTLVFDKVPFDAALRAVVETLGDYLVVQTPVGPRVTSRAASHDRTTPRRWPLKGDPARFWRRAHGETSTQSEGRWPGHPLFRLLAALVTNTREPGAEVQYDAGSHAILSSLSDGLAADLRRALETAGYLDPLPRPVLVASGAHDRVNVRALLLKVSGEQQVNVIISPQVVGQISAALPKQAKPSDLLGQIAAAAGDFVVQRLEVDLFRITSRAAQERTLSTEVIAIPAEHLSPRDLYAAVNGLVVASRIEGSSVLRSHDPKGAWSLVITLPAREQALLSEVVRASVPAPGFKRAMVGQTLFVGGSRLQAHTIQPDGSLRTTGAAFAAPGKAMSLAGWSHRLLPDGDRPPLLLSERQQERRVQRTKIPPAK